MVSESIDKTIKESTQFTDAQIVTQWRKEQLEASKSSSK
jgi:hypothetical protein